MTWVDLAFLHWPVPRSMLRALVPGELEIDTFRDTAWLGVTPFRMTNVRPVMLPPIPTARDFPELNVRTYVRHRGRAGVYFFSLDAASWLAVETARAMTGLPYYHATMKHRRAGNDIHHSSRRSMPGAPAADFRARYWPTGEVFASSPDSLEFFVTERYSLSSGTSGSSCGSTSSMSAGRCSRRTSPSISTPCPPRGSSCRRRSPTSCFPATCGWSPAFRCPRTDPRAG